MGRERVLVSRIVRELKYTNAERKRLIEQSRNGKPTAPDPIIAAHKESE